MKHLKVRTEYSFKKAYGRVADLVRLPDVVGIADSGTWGHVAFYKACEKAGKRPVLGATVPVVDTLEKGRKQVPNYVTVFAKDNTGLQHLYEMMTLANGQFYYFPRILYSQLGHFTEHMIVLSGTAPDMELFQALPGTLLLEVGPADLGWARRAPAISEATGIPLIAVADNLYSTPEQRTAYNILSGDDEYPAGGHICSEATLRAILPWLPDAAFTVSDEVYAMCDVTLPKAENVRYPKDVDLETLCREGIARRGLDWSTAYEERLQRELALIVEKDFADYFLVVADMIAEAKASMLVGPARGSSAGSLVCYLLGIVEVDPIQHGLLFERFIDTNRFDMPDIDVDFPDTKRDAVIDGLRQKYGAGKVAHIGTISRYKPKSAIAETAKLLEVDYFDTEQVKNSIVERFDGDPRANMCIVDTFESTDIGKKYIAKHPAMKAAYSLEGHARHSGVHAAGILVANEPINRFCTVAQKEGVAQIDKYDAEALNLLKIDVLGLRTLSVLEDACALAGLDFHELYNLPLDDPEPYALLNDGRVSGVFQFEGNTLRSLVKQMPIEEFGDIVALTSLARPGPLHSGGANDYANRRAGREHIRYIHPAVEPYTKETYGTIVYQEQVMSIVRGLGKFSWGDVTLIRKGISKSLGDDYFSRFLDAFKKGCAEDGVSEEDAISIWRNITTFGSWAFNKSHAVSYGLISYWCAWLKAKYPLEYATACLNNARDDDQGIRILRELVKEGFQYKPVDIVKSRDRWAVIDGVLVGGLTNIRGIGEKMARDILRRRENNEPLTKGQMNKLMNPITPFDDIFEAERRWGDIYQNPHKYNVKSLPVSHIIDVQEPGEHIIIAKLKEKHLKDMNEFARVEKRGGKVIKDKNLFLNLVVEDDTDSIMVTISRWKYESIGRKIAETGKEGDWYIIKGEMKDQWRKLYASKIKKL